MQKVKHVIRKAADILEKFAYLTVSKVSPDLMSELRYFRTFKKRINHKNPRTFSEKLIIAMKSKEYEELCDYADKVKVRDYVKNVAGEEYLMPIISIYDSPDEIDYSSIPEGAYIKLNHGSGYNYIYRRSEKRKIENQVRKAFNTDYSSFQNERQYKNIERKIIVMPDMKAGAKISFEVSIFTINGRAEIVRFKGDNMLFDVDREYKESPYHLVRNAKGKLPEFEAFHTVVEVAERLAKPFVFVRVDFLFFDYKPFFCELTFSPNAGRVSFVPDEYNYILGDKLKFDDYSKANCGFEERGQK